MCKYALANEIKQSNCWYPEHIAMLCDMAGLSDAYHGSSGEELESVVYFAALLLDVDII